MSEKRAFIASELDILYRFEYGHGPVEADYGNGMHWSDAKRLSRGRVLSVDRLYRCEACGFETRSPGTIYDHVGACAEGRGES